MVRVVNKKIIVYFENVGRKNYYLVFYVNEIYMLSVNLINVNIYLYFKENFYIKGLVDKFGVKFNIIYVGDYKSYMENLVSNIMFKEVKEDIVRVLDKNYNNFLDVVLLNRKINREDLDKIIKDGELVVVFFVDLMNNNLIDKYVYWDNVIFMVGGKDKIIII